MQTQTRAIEAERRTGKKIKETRRALNNFALNIEIKLRLQCTVYKNISVSAFSEHLHVVSFSELLYL